MKVLHRTLVGVELAKHHVYQLYHHLQGCGQVMMVSLSLTIVVIIIFAVCCIERGGNPMIRDPKLCGRTERIKTNTCISNVKNEHVLKLIIQKKRRKNKKKNQCGECYDTTNRKINHFLVGIYL